MPRFPSSSHSGFGQLGAKILKGSTPSLFPLAFLRFRMGRLVARLEQDALCACQQQREAACWGGWPHLSLSGSTLHSLWLLACSGAR